MASIWHFIASWAEATWGMVVDSAFLLLISFVLAGLLHLVLNAKTIGKIVSGGKRREVFKTALVGVPLPLCSCSVLPVAYQLRKAGVSKAGTSSFLISTPESGVDSILLTWSLMDPLMTVARPVAAFATAFAAGNVEAAFPDERESESEEERAEAGCCSSCGCGEKGSTQTGEVVQVQAVASKESWAAKLIRGIRYGFTDVFNDLASYLLVGYALAGVVVVLFGGEMIALPEWLRAGWGGYVGAIVVGLPLYICATSSTPFAAALLVAGFSPGAVLVFLLVGPATNVASLAVVSKILKGWGLTRYLLSIVGVAILCGIAVDWLYGALGVSALFRAREEGGAAWYHIAAGVLFVGLMARAIARKARKRFGASSQVSLDKV